LGALYFDSFCFHGKKIKGGILGLRSARGGHLENMLAPEAAAQVEGRMMFPLISSVCLFGGIFLVLARVLLWVVALVISGHRPVDREEA